MTSQEDVDTTEPHNKKPRYTFNVTHELPPFTMPEIVKWTQAQLAEDLPRFATYLLSSNAPYTNLILT